MKNKFISFYNLFSSLPFGIVSNYDNPSLEFNSLKNSLLTNIDDDLVIKYLNRILSEFSSDKLKLFMFDCGNANFPHYNGLPHLMVPVISDISKISACLNVIINEVNKRVECLVKANKKNIFDYNKCNNNDDDNICPMIIFIDDAYNFFQIVELRDLLINILLKSDIVGIKVVMFSKMREKNINLGPVKDLIEVCSTKNIDGILGYSEKLDEVIYDENMSGIEFENYVKKLLINNSFENVEVTNASHDFGVDIVAYKDDVKYAIQCKKYSSKVGVQAIQEVIASKSMYQCHVAVVLTNNYFTSSATELARKNNVLLWDRDKFLEMIDNIDK